MPQTRTRCPPADGERTGKRRPARGRKEPRDAREVAMRFPKRLTLLMLVTALVPVLVAGARRNDVAQRGGAATKVWHGHPGRDRFTGWKPVPRTSSRPAKKLANSSAAEPQPNRAESSPSHRISIRPEPLFTRSRRAELKNSCQKGQEFTVLQCRARTSALRLLPRHVWLRRCPCGRARNFQRRAPARHVPASRRVYLAMAASR